MAKVLVVFHSRTGHCRMLAEALAKKRGWKLGEVMYVDGRRSYARCARDALLRRAPEIRYAGPAPGRFEVVVLVSPVWCWQLCPPMRSFVRSLHGKRPQLAVLMCTGGSGAENAMAEIERQAARPIVARIALLQSEVEAASREGELRIFADEVSAHAAVRGGPTEVAAVPQSA